MPAELHLEIVEAPFPLMTRDAFRDVWRRHVLDSFEKPIFRSLIEGALRTAASRGEITYTLRWS